MVSTDAVSVERLSSRVIHLGFPYCLIPLEGGMDARRAQPTQLRKEAKRCDIGKGRGLR